MTFFAAAAVAAATVGGALISSNASENAANTQAQAGRDATQAQRDMFERQVQLQEPWRQAGGLGLNALLYGLGVSPTGTFRAGASTQLVPGADGVYAPAGTETADQIRARLAPQFAASAPVPQNFSGSNWAGGTFDAPADSGAALAALKPGLAQFLPQPAANPALDAAVQAELARQQQAQQTTTTAATQTAQADPNYGALMHDFSAADFQADPGYAFRLQQGQQALQRAKSASGSLGSGGYLKDLDTYTQGLASQEFQNSFNRYQTNRGTRLNALQSLAGVGQSSANTLTQAAGNFGQQIGSNIIGAGNAAAAGQVGAANALTGGINQGTSMYMQNQMLNRFFPQGTPYNAWAGNPMSNFFYGNGSLGD